MAAYFDAYLPGDAPRNALLKGGIVYGKGDIPVVQAGMGGKNVALPFLRAEALSVLVGANDSRYPSGADVIDLTLGFEELRAGLLWGPEHWWPLFGTPREGNMRLLVHVEQSNFRSLAKGVSRLARAFPAVHFIIDPFMTGKDGNWKAGVCLAELPNIWLTTRGLFPCGENWPKRADREAFHFVIGEVGAGRLLFASGGEAAQHTPGEWLESIQFLDEAQRKLILLENALGLIEYSPI